MMPLDDRVWEIVNQLSPLTGRFLQNCEFVRHHLRDACEEAVAVEAERYGHALAVRRSAELNTPAGTDNRPTAEDALKAVRELANIVGDIGPNLAAVNLAIGCNALLDGRRDTTAAKAIIEEGT